MDKECLKRILKINRKEQFINEEGISELCEHTNLNKEQLMHTALFLVIGFWDELEKQKAEVKKLNKDKDLLEVEYEILKESKEELTVTIREQRMDIKELKQNKGRSGNEEKDYDRIVVRNTIDGLNTKVRRSAIKIDLLRENRIELMNVLRKQGIENEILKQQLKNLEADNEKFKENRNATNNELRLNRMSVGKTAYKDKAPIEVILAYKKQGLTNEEIGEILRVSRYTIGRRLKENRVF